MLWHHLIGLVILSLALLTQLQDTQSAAVTVPSCGKGFKLIGDKCLLAFTSYGQSWYEADRYCQSMGAGLVSLHNQTQLELLNQFLVKTMVFHLEHWTSGNKLQTMRKWDYYWQNTGEKASFLPWATDQPKPKSGDCLSLLTNGTFVPNYKLTVQNCTKLLGTVCEQKHVNWRIYLKPSAYEYDEVSVN